MTSTALAVNGYLHQPRNGSFPGHAAHLQAAYRKLRAVVDGHWPLRVRLAADPTRRDYRRQTRSGNVKRAATRTDAGDRPSR
jgi:hypothetical protein